MMVEGDALGQGHHSGQGSGTVLIVEDDDDIRETMTDVLEDDGYHVRAAADGRKALDIIETLQEPSVILLDLRMPRLDGHGVLQDLEVHPAKKDSHPIFLVTAQMERMTPELVELLGREGIPILPKPFDLDRLREIVRAAFERIGQGDA